MPRTASRPRPGTGVGRSQPPSIRRLLVADALRSWAPPTSAVAILAVTMLLDAIELVPDGVAAAIAVVAFLVLAAFLVVGPLVADEQDARVPAAVAVGGAALALIVLAYPFMLRLFPGVPLRQLPLTAASKGALVASADQAPRIGIVVDAHLPLASDRRDRTVHYELDLVDDAGEHQRVSGELGDSWRTRRLGRRGTAPSHFEHLSALHGVDVGRGALHVGDVVLGGEPGATAIATVYRDRTPSVAALYAGAVLLVLGALALDLWWDRREGATATMVVASAAAAVLVFSAGGGGHPGLRDVIGAALVGAVVGVPLGASATWVARLLAPSARTRRSR